MLYFHLNKVNFIDPIIMGQKNNIGSIEIFFYETLKNILPSIKCYSGTFSDEPQFTDVSELKGKKWNLMSIDDEDMNYCADDIREIIEKAHYLKLKYVGKSLSDMGLHYDFIVQMSNKKVNTILIDYFAENNLQLLEESVGNKNMTLNEKIDFMSQELLKIKSQGNKLTIVDPYIFPKNRDKDYDELFKGIIEQSRVSSLRILTKISQCDDKLKDKIQSIINIPMNVSFTNDIHDRVWIIEDMQSGFQCGPSLNGVGKDKLTTITHLSKDDIATIINNYFNG